MLKDSAHCTAHIQASKIISNKDFKRVHHFGTIAGVIRVTFNWGPNELILYEKGPNNIRLLNKKFIF